MLHSGRAIQSCLGTTDPMSRPSRLFRGTNWCLLRSWHGRERRLAACYPERHSNEDVRSTEATSREQILAAIARQDCCCAKGLGLCSQCLQRRGRLKPVRTTGNAQILQSDDDPAIPRPDPAVGSDPQLPLGHFHSLLASRRYWAPEIQWARATPDGRFDCFLFD